jgi:hypothetical protein
MKSKGAAADGVWGELAYHGGRWAGELRVLERLELARWRRRVGGTKKNPSYLVGRGFYIAAAAV